MPRQRPARMGPELIVAILRNDTAETEHARWYLHSSLALQLLPAVPEPAAWLMLLAGLLLT
ncbi:hypothetical protein GM658_03570 [Pseudoduganella eburnea]|uniref:Uncharacterized protein n=1 Tax=Massilia eburnea TaxID=1776165 RepID=A0A6L6QBS4_9BURK|nr:hypothetical protein [Massilia eburnea]MTW09670.1 hypothetical protein [Massilia eburnea]